MFLYFSLHAEIDMVAWRRFCQAGGQSLLSVGYGGGGTRGGEKSGHVHAASGTRKLSVLPLARLDRFEVWFIYS